LKAPTVMRRSGGVFRLQVDNLRCRPAEPSVGLFLNSGVLVSVSTVAIAAWFFLSLGCWPPPGNGNDHGGDNTLADVNAPPPALGQVRFWAYQLQGLEEEGAVDRLAASHYDMLVLEPTRTDWSSESRAFDTKAMVSRLKRTAASDGVHRKLIIAYVDIGEAEDWRWYWTWSKDWPAGTPKPADWPGYIVMPDPDGWAGDYPVAYWDPNWKDVVIYGRHQSSDPYGDYVSLVDEAVRDGFDGIYLDWVEGYEDPRIRARASADGVDAAAEMIQFIAEMRHYARQRNPGFLVIQQNAVALIEGRPWLLTVIDGISQEAVWYDGNGFGGWNDPRGYDDPTDSDLTRYYIGYLDRYLAAGIPVFNCEYAVLRAGTAYSRSAARGYVAYCTRRSLARLTTTRPPGY